MLRKPQLSAVPYPWPWLVAWFTWYGRRYLRRHFHSLRCLQGPPAGSGERKPLVVYLNHPSWWDPMVCLALHDRFFAGRTGFAPIDAEMLNKYALFRKLGFFGVSQGTTRGAIRFLQTSEAILQSSAHVLWLTPQGQFEDPRARPVRFRAGLGQLLERRPGIQVLPLALEYAFWGERLPEVLVSFGDPIEPSSHPARSAEEWTDICERRLELVQDRLAIAAQRRQAGAFDCLLHGRTGVGVVYDGWRACKAQFRGETFSREHIPQ